VKYRKSETVNRDLCYRSKKRIVTLRDKKGLSLKSKYSFYLPVNLTYTGQYYDNRNFTDQTFPQGSKFKYEIRQ
jgi:hypothetical protein